MKTMSRVEPLRGHRRAGRLTAVPVRPGRPTRAAVLGFSKDFAVGVVVVVLTAAAVVVSLRTPWTLLLIPGFVSLFRWPTATVVALLITCQELPARMVSGDDWVGFGYRIYSELILRVPVFEIALVLAVVGALTASGGARKLHGQQRTALRLVLGGAIAFTLIGLAQGHSIPTAIAQDARSFLLAGCGVLLALTTSMQRGGWPLVVKAAGFSLILMALVGLAELAADGGVLEDGSRIIYYDSALPTVAAAILLAVLFTPVTTRWRVAFVLASSFIVLVSERRNVWIALLAVAALALLLRRRRLRNFTVISAATLGILGSVAFLFPGLLSQVLRRAELAAATASGTATEQSTLGHMTDVDWGLRYALQGPTLGYGPHARLPGLVVETGDLYVHNDLLQAWLRFGPVGLVVWVITIGACVVLALRRLNHPSIEGAAGVFFLLMVPICAMSAPFLLTTMRYPTLMGVAVGVALSQSAPQLRPREESTTRRSLSRRGDAGAEPPTTVLHCFPHSGVEQNGDGSE